jgi:hypothetical protein
LMKIIEQPNSYIHFHHPSESGFSATSAVYIYSLGLHPHSFPSASGRPAPRTIDDSLLLIRDGS